MDLKKAKKLDLFIRYSQNKKVREDLVDKYRKGVITKEESDKLCKLIEEQAQLVGQLMSI